MGAREFLLLGHILFAMVLIGSHIGMLLLGSRAMKAGPERAVQFVEDSVWMSGRPQGLSAILLLIFGILLVIVDGFGFGELWIVLGLAGFVLIFISVVAYVTPQSRKIVELAKQHGPGAPEVRAKMAAVRRGAILQTVIMILIVFDMIAKPGIGM